MPCFLSAAPRWRSRHRQRRRPICLPAATAAFIKLTVASRKGLQVSNREKIVNISPRCPACSPSSLPQAPLLLSPSTLCFLLLQVPGLSSHSIKKAPPFLFNLPSGHQPRPASQTLPRLTPHPPPVAAAAPHIIPGMSADCFALQCFPQKRECRKSQQMRCLTEARRHSADDCFKTQRR